MPLVKTHKIAIRGFCDTVQYIPSYELPIAKRVYKKPRKGARSPNGEGISELSFEKSDEQALRTREVASIDKEYTVLCRKYTTADVEFVYPTMQDFTKAVERAILTFATQKPEKSEIVLTGKSLRLTDEQCKKLDDAGLRTIEAVKAADLAKLSTILGIAADQAQAMRQSWWGDDEQVVIQD